MNTKDYGKMVHCLFKDPVTILGELTSCDVGLAHAAMGLVGESAEVADHVKKHVFTSSMLDVVKLIEELGDVEFYMEAIRQELGISREEVLQANMEKLAGVGGRYEHGYSNAACAARVDKEQE